MEMELRASELKIKGSKNIYSWVKIALLIGLRGQNEKLAVKVDDNDDDDDEWGKGQAMELTGLLIDADSTETSWAHSEDRSSTNLF